MYITDSRPLKCSKCDSEKYDEDFVDLGDYIAITATCSKCGNRSMIDCTKKNQVEIDEEEMRKYFKDNIYKANKYRSF